MRWNTAAGRRGQRGRAGPQAGRASGAPRIGHATWQRPIGWTMSKEAAAAVRRGAILEFRALCVDGLDARHVDSGANSGFRVPES